MVIKEFLTTYVDVADVAMEFGHPENREGDIPDVKNSIRIVLFVKRGVKG